MPNISNEACSQYKDQHGHGDECFWQEAASLLEKYFAHLGVQDATLQTVLVVETLGRAVESKHPATMPLIMLTADRLLDEKCGQCDELEVPYRLELALASSPKKQNALFDRPAELEAYSVLRCLPGNEAPLKMPTQIVVFPMASARTVFSRLYMRLRSLVTQPGEAHAGKQAGPVN